MYSTVDKLVEDVGGALWNVKHNTLSDLKDLKDKNLQTIEKIISGTTNVYKNFKVGEYHVDLYLEEYNLVVECIHASKYLDVRSDDKRTNFIKSELWCEFIRFNSLCDNFSISDVVGDIFKFILTKKNQQLEEKDHKIKLLKQQF